MKNGNTHNSWPVLDWRDHPMFRFAGAPTISLIAREQAPAAAIPNNNSELARRKDNPEGWREYERQHEQRSGSKVQRRTRR